MTDERLFNMCPDAAEPDWSIYSHLELSGVRDENKPDPDDDEPADPDRDTCCVAGQTAHEAEFFTVYGRLKADQHGIEPAEAITDINSGPLDALAVAAELSIRSGLPVVLDRALADPKAWSGPIRPTNVQSL